MELLNEIIECHIGLTLTKHGNAIHLKGPIKINNNWIHIVVYCPDYPSLKNTQLQVQQHHNYKNIFGEFCNEYQSLNELFDNLPKVLGEYSNKMDEDRKLTPVPCKGNLLDEIVKLFNPKEYEMQSNADYSRLSFTKFTEFENHFLELELPTLNIVATSLPACIEWNTIFCKCTNLANVLQRFRACLADLQTFYDNLNVIDELCHVVEPTKPSTKENYRIFTLKDRVFLKLIFMDPFAPHASISVTIIGPTKEVQHLRTVYSDGLSNWDSELDVHKNLLRIFNLCFFPMPSTTMANGDHQFCNICYTYELNGGEIPIVSCDSSHCNLIYHASCLREWFNTLIDGRTFLNVSMGACPFCKTKLSASFQELLNKLKMPE